MSDVIHSQSKKNFFFKYCNALNLRHLNCEVAREHCMQSLRNVNPSRQFIFAFVFSTRKVQQLNKNNVQKRNAGDKMN